MLAGPPVVVPRPGPDSSPVLPVESPVTDADVDTATVPLLEPCVAAEVSPLAAVSCESEVAPSVAPTVGIAPAVVCDADSPHDTVAIPTDATNARVQPHSTS